MFLDYKLFLEALYKQMKDSAPGYSFNKFSEDLGFKASTLMHQIVRGYRPLSEKNAAKIAKALKLEGMEKKFFLALVQYAHAESSQERNEYFEELITLKGKTLPSEPDKDILTYFSEWYHPVIRELIGSDDFQSDPAWIVDKIRPVLKREQVEESLQLLERLNLIARDETGRYVQTTSRVSSGHRVKGLALVSYHLQMMEHAKEALQKVSGKRRDVSALTLNVDEESAQRIRALIHAFQLQILDEAEKASKKDQVYQINIQLFPFTE